MPLIVPGDLQAYSVRQDLKDALRLHADDPGLVATHVSNSVERAVRDLATLTDDAGRTAYLSTLSARLLDIEEQKLLRDVAALQVYSTAFLFHMDSDVDPDPDFALLEEVTQTSVAFQNGGLNTPGAFGAGAYVIGQTGDDTTFFTTSGLETLDLNGDNWTIELMQRITSGAPGTQYDFFIQDGSANNIIRLELNFGGGYIFEVSDDMPASVLSHSGTWTSATWKHWAAVKEGSTLSLFYDGNRVATTTLTTETFSALSGLNRVSSGTGHGTDELRGSRVARYSGATYTPPSAPFVVD